MSGKLETQHAKKIPTQHAKNTNIARKKIPTHHVINTNIARKIIPTQNAKNTNTARNKYLVRLYLRTVYLCGDANYVERNKTDCAV